MAFIKTPGDVVERVRREAHRKGDTGTGTDRDLHKMTRDVLNDWFEELASSSWSGVGKAMRTLTVATASPTLDLPPEYMDLKAWDRSDLPTKTGSFGATPVRVLPIAAITFQWEVAGNEPGGKGAYYIEGPGKEFDDGMQAFVTIPQRIRAFPDFAAGAVVKLLFASQPPDYGDPNEEADDITPVDFMTPQNYTSVCGMVRLLYTGRGDTEEYRRALQNMVATAEAAAKRRDSQDQHRSIDPASYKRLGGSDGYGI